MNSRERKIVIFTSSLHALTHMQMLIFAAVNVRMASELGVSLEQIGLIGTIGFFLFGFGALPAGILIDKFGARKVLAAGAMLMAVADLVLAFSSGVTLAILGLALLGIGGSMYHPAGLGLISRNVEQTGHALGIHGTIGNFGVAAGPLVAGFVASMFGWRWAYLWPVIPAIAIATIFFTVRFFDVRQEELDKEKLQTQKFSGSMLKLMLLVIVIQAISGFIYRASNTFMPAFTGTALKEFFSGLDVTARGGLMTGIILLAGSIGQYVAGRMTRKHHPEVMQLVISILVVPLLLGVGYLNGVPLLASAMAFSFLFYGMQPLGNTLVAKYSPPRLRGRSYGLSFFLNFGLGAFGSGFAGSIADRMGLNVIYLWLAVISVASVFFAYLVYIGARKKNYKI